MSKDEHKLEKQFERISVKQVGSGYKLTVDFVDLGKRLDVAQLALDAQVWKDVQRYMPIMNGAAGGLLGLTNALNQTVRGKVYLYPPDSKYGHYQYMGEKYVDPVYGYGGFWTPNGWRSRKDVTKVPSGQPLHYTAPNAKPKWGEYAIAHHKDQWLQVVKKAAGMK